MKIFCSAKTEPNTAVNSDRASARRVTLCVKHSRHAAIIDGMNEDLTVKAVLYPIKVGYILFHQGIF